jgi:hypothetical protein
MLQGRPPAAIAGPPRPSAHGGDSATVLPSTSSNNTSGRSRAIAQTSKKRQPDSETLLRIWANLSRPDLGIHQFWLLERRSPEPSNRLPILSRHDSRRQRTKTERL